MKIYYDFHIHSALSPCGDNDMTPNNIVNMAVIKGLNAIAVTDHNSVRNCEAAIKAAQGLPICVLPGMELCTAEEIHVLCLFSSLEDAYGFFEEVRAKYMPVKNRPEIFGRQLVMDENDEVVGEEEILLTMSTGVQIGECAPLAKRYNGVAIPAHIDRTSYSLISVLGAVPDDLGFNRIEISSTGDINLLEAQYGSLEKFGRLKNSDAHYLENISEPENTLEVKLCTAEEIIRAITDK